MQEKFLHLILHCNLHLCCMLNVIYVIYVMWHVVLLKWRQEIMRTAQPNDRLSFRFCTLVFILSIRHLFCNLLFNFVYSWSIFAIEYCVFLNTFAQGRSILEKQEKLISNPMLKWFKGIQPLELFWWKRNVTNLTLKKKTGIFCKFMIP